MVQILVLDPQPLPVSLRDAHRGLYTAAHRHGNITKFLKDETDCVGELVPIKPLARGNGFLGALRWSSCVTRRARRISNSNRADEYLSAIFVPPVPYKPIRVSCSCSTWRWKQSQCDGTVYYEDFKAVTKDQGVTRKLKEDVELVSTLLTSSHPSELIQNKDVLEDIVDAVLEPALHTSVFVSTSPDKKKGVRIVLRTELKGVPHRYAFPNSCSITAPDGTVSIIVHDGCPPPTSAWNVTFIAAESSPVIGAVPTELTNELMVAFDLKQDVSFNSSIVDLMCTMDVYTSLSPRRDFQFRALCESSSNKEASSKNAVPGSHGVRPQQLNSTVLIAKDYSGNVYESFVSEKRDNPDFSVAISNITEQTSSFSVEDVDRLARETLRAARAFKPEVITQLKPSERRMPPMPTGLVKRTQKLRYPPLRPMPSIICSPSGHHFGVEEGSRMAYRRAVALDTCSSPADVPALVVADDKPRLEALIEEALRFEELHARKMFKRSTPAEYNSTLRAVTSDKKAERQAFNITTLAERLLNNSVKDVSSAYYNDRTSKKRPMRSSSQQRRSRRRRYLAELPPPAEIPFQLRDNIIQESDIDRILAQEQSYLDHDDLEVDFDDLIDWALEEDLPIVISSAFEGTQVFDDSAIRSEENSPSNEKESAEIDATTRISEGYVLKKSSPGGADTVLVLTPETRERYRAEYNLVGVGPNVPPSDKAIYRYITEQSWGPVTTQYARDALERTRGLEVGSDGAYLQGAVSGTQKVVSASGGWHSFIATMNYNEIRQDMAGAFAMGNYGVHFDRSHSNQATALEVLARGVQFGSILNSVDRQLGTRLKVRNFEISVQHDFDDYFNVVDSGFGTELLVQWRGWSAAIANDIREKRLGVAIGLRSYIVAILHDFDQYATVAQANWGRGWQLAVEMDFPDEFSTSNFVTIGIGRLNRVFAQAGAGIGDDGVGQATARLQSRNIGVAADFLNEFSNRILQVSFTVGKVTYVWHSSINLENIRIPNFLGIEPENVERLILSLLPASAGS